MKPLHFLVLFILSFNLTFCNPFALDNDGGKRDGARGQGNFKPPNIKNIDYNEIRKKNLENCTEYKHSGGFALTPPVKAALNCFTKIIDTQLKPLCDQERDLKEALKYYKSQRDKDGIEGIEEELLVVEELKYEIADDIYDIADEFDELKEEFLDKIDDYDDDDDHIAEKVLIGIGRVVTKTEIGAFTKALDSRARKACRNQIDLSKIKNRRR